MEARGVRQAVHRFIVDNYYVAEPARLGEGDSLLDEGIVDSTGVLEVVGFVEREFGIEVPDGDLVPENFDSIERIAGYIERRRGGA